jgi:hypothetical protein
VGLTLISLSDDKGRRGGDPSVLDQRKRTSRRQSAPARAARFGPRVDLLMSIGMANVLVLPLKGAALYIPLHGRCCGIAVCCLFVIREIERSSSGNCVVGLCQSKMSRDLASHKQLTIHHITSSKISIVALPSGIRNL